MHDGAADAEANDLIRRAMSFSHHHSGSGPRMPGLRSPLRHLLLALAATVILLNAGCSSARNHTSQRAGESDPALFTNVASSAGLHYAWTIPGPRPLNILQTIGNGCAFLDFDNDGNLDILLVGPKLALYKGDGHGHFADVTHETGLDQLHGHFLGCAVGDYDNDGYDDLYVSAYRGGVLLHNEERSGGVVGSITPILHHSTTPSLHHSRFFRDVTKQAGIAPQPWGTSAGFVETVPGSGRLDLIVANYARFGPEPGIPQLCPQKDIHGQLLMTSCGPREYTPLKAVLFRNLGGGRFAPASALTVVSGRGLGVGGCDYDASGRQSIAFANDEITGDLLQNTGAGAGGAAFHNVGPVSGTAYDRDGNVHGGMGLDWGDYDNDGRMDLLETTFQNEPTSLYHNQGDGMFTDTSYPSGIGQPTYPNVGFGCKFVDYDNDGWPDIAIANGHVQDNIAQIDASTQYRQTMQLFHNSGPDSGGRVTFAEVSAQGGPDFRRGIVGRGLAIGDYDNDGRVDLLVVDSEGAPMLLHNKAKQPNHWLGVRLIGTRSNRDGYGAILTVEAGGRRLVQLCHADGSYMSSSDPRVHFGLGSATSIDRMTIRWPSGKVDSLTRVPVDRYVTVHEGADAVGP